MITSVVCFTANGTQTARRTADALGTDRIWLKKKGAQPPEGIELLSEGLQDWTAQRFADSDCIVYVGATGIAVRAVAPFLKSKKTDPAVLCIDEKGTYVIPLVSGHIGGANELALKVAGQIGAIPVVTTATDLNGRFAVDVFARRNGLVITDMTLAKEISARILDGEKIGFVSDFPMDGVRPAELCDPGQGEQIGIRISVRRSPAPEGRWLTLIPPAVVAGIGCRRGKEAEELRAFFTEVFCENELYEEACCRICSIDLKKDEEGLIALAKDLGIEFDTFTSEQLAAVEGEFTPSTFVSSKTGVDNVCERSAVLGSQGELIFRKTARNGMTAAAALREWRGNYEQ